MADPTRRMVAWKAKATPERTKQALDARFADMQQRYEAAMADLCAMETEVKTILNGAGIDTCVYVPYLDFARQLYRLTRKRQISGPSFALAAKVLLDKWHARGMDASILALIRTQVFDIGEPAA